MKRILLLINPKSRSGASACVEIEVALKNSRHRLIELSEEEKKEDFNHLIHKYKNDIDLVIVGGGDGSINYVLSSLVESQVPLLVCPLGTANLLAKSLNLSANVDSLMKLVDDGEIVSIDLGTVNDIYFINVTGMGISTEVNRYLPKDLKKKAGHFSFWLWGLKLITKMKPFTATITVNQNRPITTKTWQVTVCNGRHYANWMTIEKDATYSDGKLHCLSTDVKEWWHGIFLLPSYLTGRYKDNQDVTMIEGQQVKIETRKPHKIDVDGDVKTSTPAIFKVVPKALKIIVPQLKQPALT